MNARRAGHLLAVRVRLVLCVCVAAVAGCGGGGSGAAHEKKAASPRDAATPRESIETASQRIARAIQARDCDPPEALWHEWVVRAPHFRDVCERMMPRFATAYARARPRATGYGMGGVIHVGNELTLMLAVDRTGKYKVASSILGTMRNGARPGRRAFLVAIWVLRAIQRSDCGTLSKLAADPGMSRRQFCEVQLSSPLRRELVAENEDPFPYAYGGDGTAAFYGFGSTQHFFTLIFLGLPNGFKYAGFFPAQ